MKSTISKLIFISTIIIIILLAGFYIKLDSTEKSIPEKSDSPNITQIIQDQS